jgi:DNA-binding GntR family transcriptional regulator
MLEDLREANSQRDEAAFTYADVRVHQEIWRQSGSSRLRRMLDAITGPVIMHAASHLKYVDWDEVLQMHVEIVDQVNAGDGASAKACLERSLRHGLEHSLLALQRG